MKKSTLRFRISKIIGVLFLSAFFCSTASAAQIFMDVSTKSFKTGTAFEVPVSIDTENENLNAFEGTVTFPADLLDVSEIRDGSSIITFWIERANVKSSGNIFFSGIIPGGYNKEAGLLFSVVFTSKKTGTGSIKLEDIRVLKNDGAANSAKVSSRTFKFITSDESPEVIPSQLTLNDKDLPEDFSLSVQQDPDMFEGRNFIVFATQDKLSGIDHYEVCEGDVSLCERADSPFVLKNQSINVIIFVKAIDKKGNVRIASLSPQVLWYKNYTLLAIILLILFFSVISVKRRLFGSKHL